jgi:hypothetical protein
MISMYDVLVLCFVVAFIALESSHRVDMCSVSAVSAVHPAFIFSFKLNTTRDYTHDRRYGLVVRVPGYNPRGPGFALRRYHIF